MFQRGWNHHPAVDVNVLLIFVQPARYGAKEIGTWETYQILEILP